MTNETLPYEPGVLRVLQSKEETRHYYNKIAKVYCFASVETGRTLCLG